MPLHYPAEFRQRVLALIDAGASRAVSTVKKSVATMALAWEAVNSDHEGPVRNPRLAP